MVGLSCYDRPALRGISVSLQVRVQALPGRLIPGRVAWTAPHSGDSMDNDKGRTRGVMLGCVTMIVGQVRVCWSVGVCGVCVRRSAGCPDTLNQQPSEERA